FIFSCIHFILRRRHPICPLFPYTTLFRSFDDCDFSDEGFQLDRSGDMTLEPETSTSWTAGVVWSPMPELDFTLDWYDIEMRNQTDRKSTRLNSSHVKISYAVFCLIKKIIY